MAIDPRLLEQIVCLFCRSGLREEAAGLTCVGCGRVYPVRDGIPVMLAEEASPPRT
ncbi:MAG TPA: Trm112 family protein [Candidatus Polarisedimenticolaceae bacterium]|nr:Trm112 family protein [Candidatus Polarisedimenticolaceae bacterium]